MPVPKNIERAQWALVALKAFADETGIDDEDLHLQVSDLLADLMHLADYEDLDWDSLIQRADGHYQAEVFEDGRALKSPRDWSPREKKRRKGRS